MAISFDFTKNSIGNRAPKIYGRASREQALVEGPQLRIQYFCTDKLLKKKKYVIFSRIVRLMSNSRGTECKKKKKYVFVHHVLHQRDK